MLSKHKQGLLLLDYDGTLAPFRKNRLLAHMDLRIQKTLQAICADRKIDVVIISGRALKHLLPLLSLSPLPEVWGSHGFEHLGPRGGYYKAACPKRVCIGLKAARTVALSLVSSMHCEVKPFSIAVHVRAMTAKTKKRILTELKRRWKPIAQEHGLRIHPFKEGLEIGIGRNKGSVVQNIIAKVPCGIPIAYIGDDTTDEDAFLALGNRGLKILVGKKRGVTHAEVQLQSIGKVAIFLRCCLRTVQEHAEGTLEEQDGPARKDT